MTAQANQPMPKRKLGSVQRSFVGASAVSKAVLCIAAPGGGMEYVAVLQIEGISYSLKSEEERLVLSDLYQAFLCGLSFPVQVILRSLPLKLEDYLAHFTASLAGAASSETPQ